VNQHIKELKDVGLIHGHICGVKTNYCLNPAKVDRVKKLVHDFLESVDIQCCKPL
jgi:hypothetical protein